MLRERGSQIRIDRFSEMAWSRVVVWLWRGICYQFKGWPGASAAPRSWRPLAGFNQRILCYR